MDAGEDDAVIRARCICGVALNGAGGYFIDQVRQACHNKADL